MSSYSRFVTHDQRFGVSHFVDYGRALLDELQDALERSGSLGAFGPRDKPLLTALRELESMSSHYGHMPVNDGNRDLLERRRGPLTLVDGRYFDPVPGPSLRIIGQPWMRELREAEPFFPEDESRAAHDLLTLRRLEAVLPAALSRAVELGAPESLLLYQSPGADRLREFDEAVALGGGFRQQNDMSLLIAPELFCVALEFYIGSESDQAAYLGRDGNPVVALSQAAFFSCERAAFDFLDPLLPELDHPVWAIARVAASPMGFSRPAPPGSGDRDPVDQLPSMPIFERALAASQARQMESETAVSKIVRAPSARL